MLQHILVGLDGSPLAETILEYVSTVARAVGADIMLLRVIHLPEEVRDGEHSQNVQSLLRNEETLVQEYLQQVERRLTTAGLTTQSRVAVGDAASTIVRIAQDEGRELIALATHGRSGLQRWVYGSVAEKVLHTTHTPLLLIRPTEEQTVAPQELTHIVVPLDGSPLAEAVLPVATTLAIRANVPLVLLRVVEVLSLDYASASGIGYAGYPQLLESLQAAAAEYLQQSALAIGDQDVSVYREAPVGLPASEIIKYAHEHPGSLVVMTTHGRTGLTEFVMGSVARRVILHGNMPTLVVRPSVTAAAVDPSTSKA